MPTKKEIFWAVYEPEPKSERSLISSSSFPAKRLFSFSAVFPTRKDATNYLACLTAREKAAKMQIKKVVLVDV